MTLRYLLIICCLMLTTSHAYASERILNIQEVITPAGITFWLNEDKSVPVISLEFSFQNTGGKNDLSDKQGLTRLASNTMDEGAGDLTSEEFQKALNDHSITLRFNASRDDFGGKLKTLTKHKDKAFDLLRLAINEPRFDDEPVKRMVQSNQARIRNSLSKPGWVAARIMNDRAFENHPYNFNSGGTLTTLEAITRDDLIRFHKDRIVRGNLLISIVGDISRQDASRLIDASFGTLPNTAYNSQTENLELQNQGKIYVFEKDLPQNVIEMMQPGVTRNHSDYHAFQVMNFILGGSGFGSRLTEEIREKRGLTYGIYSYINNLDHVTGLSVTTSTSASNTAQMIDLIHELWEGMKQNEVSDEELLSAKNYLVGALPLSLTSTDSIAKTMLSLQLDGLPTDYLSQRSQAIKNISAQDVLDVAQTYLDLEKFVTVIVGQKQDDARFEAVEIISEVPNVE